MNRSSRRGRVPRRNESTGRLNAYRSKAWADIEDENPNRLYKKRTEKSVINRCTYVTPDLKDFSQSTGKTVNTHKVIITDQELPERPHPPEPFLFAEQYGFQPRPPPPPPRRKEYKSVKVHCANPVKVETSSQYSHHNAQNKCVSPPSYTDISEGCQWQNVDSVDEIDKIILKDGGVSPINFDEIPEHIFISEIPRVKIIAEKFSKYKRNNLELRRLDEKVVCVEYDIYDQTACGEVLIMPIQTMRAFFSIKPNSDDKKLTKESHGVPILPSKIKRTFDISDDDLQKLTEEEIEIIDGTIYENRTYLDDFKRILKRKQNINVKKNKTSLDLQSLYHMAKTENPILDSDYSEANLLSKAELQEVKDLILQRCGSSVHGISRRRVKAKEEPTVVNVISETIVAELLKENDKFHVY